jgi:hypothetical protein
VVVAFVIPIALDLAYNAARFGSPFESGPGLIPSGVAGASFGSASPSMASIPAPLVGPLSIVLTTPVFLWAFLARRPDWFGIGAWTSIVLTLVLIVVSGQAGAQGFGYPAALAFYPFLFILAVRGFGLRVSWQASVAMGIGLAVNAYGMAVVALH